MLLKDLRAALPIVQPHGWAGLGPGAGLGWLVGGQQLIPSPTGWSPWEWHPPDPQGHSRFSAPKICRVRTGQEVHV